MQSHSTLEVVQGQCAYGSAASVVTDTGKEVVPNNAPEAVHTRRSSGRRRRTWIVAAVAAVVIVAAIVGGTVGGVLSRRHANAKTVGITTIAATSHLAASNHTSATGIQTHAVFFQTADGALLARLRNDTAAWSTLNLTAAFPDVDVAAGRALASAAGDSIGLWCFLNNGALQRFVWTGDDATDAAQWTTAVVADVAASGRSQLAAGVQDGGFVIAYETDSGGLSVDLVGDASADSGTTNTTGLAALSASGLSLLPVDDDAADGFFLLFQDNVYVYSSVYDGSWGNASIQMGHSDIAAGGEIASTHSQDGVFCVFSLYNGSLTSIYGDVTVDGGSVSNLSAMATTTQGTFYGLRNGTVASYRVEANATALSMLLEYGESVYP